MAPTSTMNSRTLSDHLGLDENFEDSLHNSELTDEVDSFGGQHGNKHKEHNRELTDEVDSFGGHLGNKHNKEQNNQNERDEDKDRDSAEEVGHGWYGQYGSLSDLSLFDLGE